MRISDISLQGHENTRPTNYLSYQNYFPNCFLNGDLVKVEECPPYDEKDIALVKRIMAFYQNANAKHTQEATGVWAYLNTLKEDTHNLLMADDAEAVLYAFENPGSNMILHGFDSPTSQSIQHQDELHWLLNYRNLCSGSVRRLAEAMAVQPIFYPEGISPNDEPVPLGGVDETLDAIGHEMGAEICFPSTYKDEIGLKTRFGVASYRAIQALYQAWRIRETARTHLSQGGGPLSVLEIGGGTGRTAYNAFKLGIKNYTIVDLPLTGVIQAYFIGKTLGGECLHLEGEPLTPNTVSIITPPALFAAHKIFFRLFGKQPDKEVRQNFDIVANFDSLVEFSEEDASEYIDFIIKHSKIFLSGNRESKGFSVRGLLAKRGITASRYPFWLRRGYVEEIAILRK